MGMVTRKPLFYQQIILTVFAFLNTNYKLCEGLNLLGRIKLKSGICYKLLCDLMIQPSLAAADKCAWLSCQLPWQLPDAHAPNRHSLEGVLLMYPDRLCHGFQNQVHRIWLFYCSYIGVGLSYKWGNHAGFSNLHTWCEKYTYHTHLNNIKNIYFCPSHFLHMSQS